MSVRRASALRLGALRGAEVAAAIALLLILGQTVANAVARRFFDDPIAGTNEAVGNLYMPALVLLGLVVAQAQRQHIEARLVFDRLPAGVQYAWHATGIVLSLVVLAAIGWYGWGEARHAQEVGRTAGVTGLTIWPVFYLVPLGCLAYGAELVREVVVMITRPDQRPALVQDSELMA
jgi:TRAP-type C4-dicarboxylate transport system permease small subunit